MKVSAFVSSSRHYTLYVQESTKTPFPCQCPVTGHPNRRQGKCLCMDQNHSKAANTVSRKANMQKLRFLGSLLFLIKASESSHRNEGKCICVFLASLCIYICFQASNKTPFPCQGPVTGHPNRRQCKCLSMDQNHSKAATTVSRKANMQKLRFLGS